ncbi:helix-turn-helix transcriptional regulator [Luteibacter yeojuensis]
MQPSVSSQKNDLSREAVATRTQWVNSRFNSHISSRTTKPAPSAAELLKSKEEWRDREYRACYAEAAVEQGVAFQIQVNRKRRGWSQKELADRVGTRQNAICRLEDPDYGSHSLRMLMKVAAAFDVALIVKLASFSTLARESESLSEHQLYAAGYDEEIGMDET